MLWPNVPHLLAASGQNVALLCALAFPLLMLVGAPQRVRVAVLLPLVAIYVALAGSGASITRAGIMAGAGLLAIAAGRRSSAVYSLLLAAVITLAMNPRTPGDPGWQLSFAAVAGMLALGPVLRRPLRRLPRPVAEAVAATLAATISTSPLLAHEFGAVSIAALPANLLAFPAVAPIMWIGMGEAALQQVVGLGGPLASTVHAFEGVFAPVTSLALRWIAAVATRFADPAWAQAQIRLSWPAVVAMYAAVALVVVLATRWRGASLPGPALDWLRSLSPSSRRAFAAPLAALTLAAAAEAAAPPPPPRHLTVDFVDVGQGDSTLIRDPAGAAVLFDGGVPEARVDRSLRRLGVRKLSVVVATHQSRDHHAGLLQVIRRFPVGLFLDGRDGVRDASFVALENEVDRRRIPRRPTRAGERLHVGGITIHILWPPPRRADEPPPADPNERATVAIVSAGAFHLFLSADAESPVLLPLDLPHVDAMKVPHHGSADAGLPQLLDRLQPKIAAIETGRGNRYGHPTPQTLNALRGRVPRVYRSDRDGTTELTVDNDRIAIRTHRQPLSHARPEARLPRLRRRRRQDRRLALAREAESRGRRRPRRARAARRNCTPAGRPRRRSSGAHVRDRHPLSPHRRRRDLEGHPARPARERSRADAAGDRPGPRRARQGAGAPVQSSGESRRRGPGIRGAERAPARQVDDRACRRTEPEDRRRGRSHAGAAGRPAPAANRARGGASRAARVPRGPPRRRADRGDGRRGARAPGVRAGRCDRRGQRAPRACQRGATDASGRGPGTAAVFGRAPPPRRAPRRRATGRRHDRVRCGGAAGDAAVACQADDLRGQESGAPGPRRRDLRVREARDRPARRRTPRRLLPRRADSAFACDRPRLRRDPEAASGGLIRTRLTLTGTIPVNVRRVALELELTIV